MKLYPIYENLINEGASDILYHFTSTKSLETILSDNQLNLTSKIGSPADDKSKEYYYMSFTRSKSTKLGYGSRFNFIGAVRLTVNGQKLNQNYKVIPIDYWQYTKTPEFMKQTSSDEMEDRLVSDKEKIPNANNYIIAIDVLTKDGEISESLIQNAQKLGIKLNVFDNEKYFSYGNQKYTVKPKPKQSDDEIYTENDKYLYDIIGILTYKEPELFDQLKDSMNDELINKIKEYHTDLKYKLQPNSYKIKELTGSLESSITNRKQTPNKLFRKVLHMLTNDFKKTNSENMYQYLESKIYKGVKRQQDYNKELKHELKKLIANAINKNKEYQITAWSKDYNTNHENIFEIPQVKDFINNKINEIINYSLNYITTNDDMFHEAYKIAYSELKDKFNIKENNPEVVKLSELFNDVYPSEILEPILNVIWAIDAIGTKMYDAKEQYKKELYTVN